MLAVSPRVFVGFVMRIEIAQGALAFKQGGEQLPLDHLPPAAPSSSRALQATVQNERIQPRNACNGRHGDEYGNPPPTE